MSGKGFKCNSCSYALIIDDDVKKELWCPNCRATMAASDMEAPAEFLNYECGECKARFRAPGGTHAPYKCPRCNYTIPSKPKP
ncbi:MAG: hypothetical protein WCX65_11075 [bacterium]